MVMTHPNFRRDQHIKNSGVKKLRSFFYYLTEIIFLKNG